MATKQVNLAKQAQIIDGILVICLPLLPAPRPSKSGKNLTVATTSGNTRTECTINDQPVTIGVNAYIPA